MKCEVCGIGKRKEKLIRYSLMMDDKLVIVENVPASVCESCGETAIAPDVLERLQEMIWHSPTPVKVLEAPVYEFEQSLA